LIKKYQVDIYIDNMDVNAILNQYTDINQHIDDLNKANKIDFDTKMGTAQGEEFVKGLISKGKATQDVISGISSSAQGIVDKAAKAAKAAKASKLAGGVGEGAELELQAIGTGSKVAKVTSAIQEATAGRLASAATSAIQEATATGGQLASAATSAIQEVAATGGQLASAVKSTVGVLSQGVKGTGGVAEAANVLSDVGNIAATGGRLAAAAKTTVGALSKGGAAFGVGLGLYDVGANIVQDVQKGKIDISGNNWQEKLGTVGEEISGGLDAAGLALGPEFLLAGAVVGGAAEILNIWGGKKDHEGVPEPPPPVVEQNVSPPNLAQLGMVQNHINNIKQFTN
jgi:hypothetical protein